jgi:hypothetical protein
MAGPDRVKLEQEQVKQEQEQEQEKAEQEEEKYMVPQERQAGGAQYCDMLTQVTAHAPHACTAHARRTLISQVYLS